MTEHGFDEELQRIAEKLKEILKHTEDEKIISRLESVMNSLAVLQELYEEAARVGEEEEQKLCEDDDGGEEELQESADGAEEEAARAEREEFALRYAQLVGLSEQFNVLGRKRPESACGAFKAQQVNRVLIPLKEMIGEDLDLVSEEGEQSYSDVSLLIRAVMDLCVCFAHRQGYDLQHGSRGHEIPSRAFGYGYR